MQRARAEQRHRHGEQPHAQAAGVAHVDPIGYRAHGAEVRLVSDRAEDEGERERASGDVRSKLLRIQRCLAKAARRCLALIAELDAGYLAMRSSRVFWADLRSPMVSCALAIDSMASGAFGLSGQPARSLRCALMALL